MTVVGTILLIVGVLVVVAVIAVLWTLTHPGEWALKRVGGFYPSCLFRIATTERALALTIDDAPHPDVTPGILSELRRPLRSSLTSISTAPGSAQRGTTCVKDP